MGLGGLKEAYLDSPTSDKHGEHSTKTPVCATRGGGQAGEKSDDTGCTHLNTRIRVVQEREARKKDPIKQS